ncbi:MAG: PilZ domain-containing protein [Desulfitobacterium hafniense]|nr:PilZ domain-containing protein [Desulfitobacterium hafniense]
MSYRKKLVPDLTVDLTVLDGEYAGQFRTRIDEVGERLISVLAPYSDGGIVPLHEGSMLEVTFWDEVSAYTFQSKLIQRINVPVPVFVLELPQMASKIQRRNFVRVAAFYPVLYRAVTREGLTDFKKANMLDLSGGGARFQAGEALEKNSLIYLHLKLPLGEIETPARVCRVDKIEDTSKFTISVEFHEISEKLRDKIIRVVFDLQREMRKKGLI